jgi:LAGLIDADG endonuclease
MVINQKMIEIEMGYRGSKSEVSFQLPRPKLNEISVKAQRVNGNYFLFRRLRYTLMEGESSYQLKILSNRLNIKQFSTSTLTSSPYLQDLMTCKHKNIQLNPWFVSGLIDAEGTFTISIRKDSEYNLGWQIGAEFQIQLHKRDLNLLLEFQEFFSGIGSISIGKTRQRVTYSVKSIKDITNTIIPPFLKYSLLTNKAADFYLFTKVVELISAKAHLTIEGLQQIINIKASMNLGISENLKSYFTLIIPVERPLVNTTSIPDPNWIAGFVSGEGCFDINLKKSKSHRTGYQVILRFSIKQHEKDKSLMELVSKYLGCGNIYPAYTRGYSCCSLTTVKYSDITNLIIPFFNTYPVLGKKQQDFLDWCKVAKLMNEGSHLTNEGLNLIQTIKKGMNKERENN